MTSNQALQASGSRWGQKVLIPFGIWLNLNGETVQILKVFIFIGANGKQRRKGAHFKNEAGESCAHPFNMGQMPQGQHTLNGTERLEPMAPKAPSGDYIYDSNQVVSVVKK